jgi:hypothetical protein
VVAIDGLAAILYDLESGQPYILIDELSVRSQRPRRRLGSTSEAAPWLDITLELSGFVRAASV